MSLRRPKKPFFFSFSFSGIGVSCGGAPDGGGSITTVSEERGGFAWPATVGTGEGCIVAPDGLAGVVSHPATCVVPPPCKWQNSFGCVPEMNTSARTVGTGSRGELAGLGIDIDADDPVRRVEIDDIAVLAMLVRPLHELGPDGQRGLRAFEVRVRDCRRSRPRRRR